MMNDIIVNCTHISQGDVSEVNTALHNFDMKVTLSTKRELLNNASDIFVSILLIAQQGILGNMSYEGIKYAINFFLSKLEKRNKDKNVTIELFVNNKKEYIIFNFELSEFQKNQIVERTLEKFMKKSD